MKWSLRRKLALSHIIPTILLLPILSLFLLYTLEDFYTDNLLRQLANQARLLRDEIERHPELIASPSSAQNFLGALASKTDSRVVLFDPHAVIVASSRTEDAARIGTRFADSSVIQALQGETTQGVGQGITNLVGYVVVPIQINQQTIAALRLSYNVEDAHVQFSEMRWLIVGGVVATVGVALILALGLATTIVRPLRQLRASAQNIAAGNYRVRAPVYTQDEVGALAHSFNQMAVNLEQAQKARERQLAAIVHELARPLTGMRAAVETLRDGAEEERDVREMLLEGITNELARLERLTNTLQGVYQRGLRPLQLNRAEISLERIILASIANFRSIASQAGITLGVQVPSHLPMIRADEDRLIQVMTNLLDNALKFTPRGGHVTVQVGKETDAVWVRVADTGAGIAPAEMPYIFQQFYRGDESRPPEKRGVGLGLAICREILTAHGGEIRVESDVGLGTRFTFRLPK